MLGKNGVTILGYRVVGVWLLGEFLLLSSFFSSDASRSGLIIVVALSRLPLRSTLFGFPEFICFSIDSAALTSLAAVT